MAACRNGGMSKRRDVGMPTCNQMYKQSPKCAVNRTRGADQGQNKKETTETTGEKVEEQKGTSNVMTGRKLGS